MDADKQSALFLRLIYMFHSAAMQGLGKIANPLTGKTERYLTGAAASIDTLDMLAAKTRGNLSQDEERLLKHLISELKLNYVDELKNGPSAVGSEKDEAVRHQSQT